MKYHSLNGGVYEIENTKILIQLEKLRKELYKKYPPQHFAHLKIFMNFWGFYDTLIMENVNE